MTATPTRRPPLMRNPLARHQIRIFLTGPGKNQIAVSCACMGRPPRGHCEPLEARSSWGPGEAQAVWAAHMAGLSPQGATLEQEKEGTS